MITPTIGRVVLFTPHLAERYQSHQPWPALITYVHGPNMINIGGFTPNGEPFARTSVRLLQDDDKPYNDNEAYAAWMPYQVAQAAAQAQTVVPAVVKGGPTPEDCQLIQPFNLREINPNVWLYVNLQLGEADSEKITPRNRAAIRINCGCDDDGNLQPAFGRMFEQADSVTENARLERINASPRVGEVTENPPYRETGRPLGAVLGLLGENKVPMIYALRAKNWAAVQEFINTNAEILARA